MSLLPTNESFEYKRLDECLASRINALKAVNLSNIPKTCDARYLPILAKSLDADISYLSEDEARAFLESALYLKQYAGTPSVLKKVLYTIYSDVEIDDQVGGYLFDIEVELKSDVSIEKLENIKKIINRYKNVRSRLRHFVMSMPDIEQIYKIIPAMIFSPVVDANSMWNLEHKAPIRVAPNAIYRFQSEQNATPSLSARANIPKKSGSIWRVQLECSFV